MIQVGDAIPNANITVVHSDGQETVTAEAYFSGKKTVLFSLPGAFTPTCSAAHLPGYVVNYDAFVEKGVDIVACLSVNDSFVMKAWQDTQNAENIVMVADGGSALTEALGLTLDTGDFGGVRSQRYAMVIDDGKVTHLNVEPGTDLDVSSAETMLGLV